MKTVFITGAAAGIGLATARDRSIDLSPEDIARSIDRAVQGNRVSYLVGNAAAHVWALLDKLLPEFLGVKLTAKISGNH